MNKKMKASERIREIVNRGTVTADDKVFIEELSKELGLQFDQKKGCKDCYMDQAMVIYKAVKEDEPHDGSPRLRDDIDVVINGVRINNATLTPELVEKYRGKGLPEHWFV